MESNFRTNLEEPNKTPTGPVQDNPKFSAHKIEKSSKLKTFLEGEVDRNIQRDLGVQALQTYKDNDINGFYKAAADRGKDQLKYTVGSLAAIYMTPYAWKFLNHPLIQTAFTTDGIINNVTSDDGWRKTWREYQAGNYGKAALSGAVDALDFVGGVGLLKTTGNGIKRGLEVLVRQGDQLFKDTSKTVRNLLKNRDVYKYVLLNNPEAAYKTGLYNGTLSSLNKGGFKGDPVDMFFGKGYDQTKYREAKDQSYSVFYNYIKKNYPRKNIKVYEIIGDPKTIKYNYSDELQDIINNATNSKKLSVTQSQGTFNDLNFGRINNDGISIYRSTPSYDAGGHQVVFAPFKFGNSKINNAIQMQRQDIWKYNPNDFLNRYGARMNFPKRIGTKILGNVLDFVGNPYIMKEPSLTIVNNKSLENFNTNRFELEDYQEALNSLLNNKL